MSGALAFQFNVFPSAMMNKPTILPLIAVLCFGAFAGPLQAQLLEANTDFDRADTLRGALRPERTCYDVTFYHLDIRVDPEARAIEGSNRIVYRATEDFERLQIDLFENMQISKIVTGNGQEANFTREANAVWVDLPFTQKKNLTGEITVYYGGKPIVAKRAPWDGGFTWEKDQEGNHWIGVSCEGIGASLWWPNKDHLSDEPDSMAISVTIPEDLMYVGNGNLRTEHEAVDGYKRWDWFVDNPINNYNVTLNIANYVHFGEVFNGVRGELACDYYVLPYNLEKAKSQFQQVGPMMECFETYFAPYPFYEDGYALVETPYLGMEHQSAIAYGNEYKTGYAGFDFSRIGLDFDYIIIHETGHEWWGNSISCADMADLWIHEGFCTYSEAIYVECMHGYDTAMLYVNAKIPSVGNKAPIVGVYDVNEEGSGDMYNKGMLILNTVRHLFNDDEAWFKTLKGVSVDFEQTVVHTSEIEEYISSRSTGMEMNWQAFWDQYLRHADIPRLELDVSGKGKKATVKYRWLTDVEGFNMPVSYTTGKGKRGWLQPTNEWQELEVKSKPNEFEVEADKFYFGRK